MTITIFGQLGQLLDGAASLIAAVLIPVAAVKVMRLYCGAFGTKWTSNKPGSDA